MVSLFPDLYLFHRQIQRNNSWLTIAIDFTFNFPNCASEISNRERWGTGSNSLRTKRSQAAGEGGGGGGACSWQLNFWNRLVQLMVKESAFTHGASIYDNWKKRKRLHLEKSTILTGLSCYTNMAAVLLFWTPIWPLWRHVKTLYKSKLYIKMSHNVVDFFLFSFSGLLQSQSL